MIKQNGFTLLELMIACAIVGILAAIAVPTYQNYVIRSQVSEAFILASSLKPAIVEHYASTGRFPLTIPGSIPGIGKYVESIVLTDGVIIATFGRQSNPVLRREGSNQVGVTFGLAPNGSVIFVCGRATSPIMVTGLAGDASAVTTIPAKYLPHVCRA